MFREVKIRLAVSAVQPLLLVLQEQIADLDAKNRPLAYEEADRRKTNDDEVQTFLALFHPDFSNTGVVRVTQRECPAVLRACSFLRLYLRYNALSFIADETLESGIDPTGYVG